ncbi:MAG: hypothetical protein VXW27_09760, partial [Pseudomonadota bacterium]|nr:hypothetical protein [Pseudomonadota bacterium]
LMEEPSGLMCKIMAHPAGYAELLRLRLSLKMGTEPAVTSARTALQVSQADVELVLESITWNGLLRAALDDPATLAARAMRRDVATEAAQMQAEEAAEAAMREAELDAATIKLQALARGRAGRRASAAMLGGGGGERVGLEQRPAARVGT